MPKFDGVYQDTKGRWYFKVWLGRDPISGRQSQVTKRGFSTAADAVRARRELLSDFDVGRRTTAAPASLTSMICSMSTWMASTRTSVWPGRRASTIGRTRTPTFGRGWGRSGCGI